MSASSKQVKSCLPMKRQSSSVSKETQYTETDEDRTDSDWELVSQETPARKRQIRIDKEKRSQKAREKQRRTKHARSILDCPSSVDQSVPHEAYFRNSFIGCADGIDRSCLKMKVKFRDTTEPSYVSMFENGVISVDVITIKRFAFFLSRSSKDWAAFAVWCRESFHGACIYETYQIFMRAICYHYALLQERNEEEISLYKLIDKGSNIYEWEYVADHIDWKTYHKGKFRLMGVHMANLCFRKFKRYRVKKDKIIRADDFEEDE